MSGRPTICAVFDLDGTLVDSAGHCADVLNAMLAERGAARRLSVPQTRRHMALGGVKMVEALLGEDCGDPQAEIADFRRRYRAERMSAACLFPGVREGLAGMAAAGVSLAVCSNKPQDLCARTLADLQLADLFDAVVGSREGFPLKPDPYLYDHVLESVGAPRNRSCYVGDDRVDQQMAQTAGVPFILAAYGYGADTAAFAGARRVASFAEVPATVARAMAEPASRA